MSSSFRCVWRRSAHGTTHLRTYIITHSRVSRRCISRNIRVLKIHLSKLHIPSSLLINSIMVTSTTHLIAVYVVEHQAKYSHYIRCRVVYIEYLSATTRVQSASNYCIIIVYTVCKLGSKFQHRFKISRIFIAERIFIPANDNNIMFLFISKTISLFKIS